MSTLSTEYQQPSALSGNFTSEPTVSEPLHQKTIEEEDLKPQPPRVLEHEEPSEIREIFVDRTPLLQTYRVKLEGIDSFTGPWLPPNAVKLLDKSKISELSPKECVKLMDILAERATEHFQLQLGKFVAITLSGKIAELADTKLELLRRVQKRKFPEQIFLWKVGSDSFSGRR